MKTMVYFEKCFSLNASQINRLTDACFARMDLLHRRIFNLCNISGGCRQHDKVGNHSRLIVLLLIKSNLPAKPR